MRKMRFILLCATMSAVAGMGTFSYAGPMDAAQLSALLGAKGTADLSAKLGQQTTSSIGATETPPLTVIPPQPEEHSVIEENFNQRLITSGLRLTISQVSAASQGGSANQAVVEGTSKGDMSNDSVILKSGQKIALLKQFGYQLFSNPSSSLAPMTDIPIPPEYVLGPGDELRVQYYGSRSDSLSLTVDRNGMVNVPDIGEIGLAGMSYNAARAVLAEHVSKKLTGVTASITMGRLRSIRIFVLGDVRNPGSYQVSSLATVSYALFASGGPSKRGTLRHIQLKRAGRVATEIDMYDFLLKGDGRKDRQLMPGDVVFVPPIGDVVAVAGEVSRPGIYELSQERGISEAIKLAGKPLHSADKARVEVDRIDRSGSRQQISFDLDDKKLEVVRAGDLISFYPVLQDMGPYVELSGATKRPGRYGFKVGMKLSDLLQGQDGLLPESYLKRVEITHHTVVNGERRETTREESDYTQVLSGVAEANTVLRPYDEVLVRSVADWGESKKVTLEGEVNFPGTYVIAKGDTLSSLVERAGGLTDQAYLPAMVITREAIKKQQIEDNKRYAEQVKRQLQKMNDEAAQLRDPELTKAKAINIEQLRATLAAIESTEPVGRLLLESVDENGGKIDGALDIPLRAGDNIKIPERPSEVIVMGQVYNPAALSYIKNRSRDDYVEMAGGVSDTGKAENTFVVRASGVVVAGKKAKNPKIMPGDAIVVPQDADHMNLIDGAIAWTKILMQSGVSLATLKALKVF